MSNNIFDDDFEPDDIGDLSKDRRKNGSRILNEAKRRKNEERRAKKRMRIENDRHQSLIESEDMVGLSVIIWAILMLTIGTLGIFVLEIYPGGLPPIYLPGLVVISVIIALILKKL